MPPPKQPISPCYVSVRKLSLEEISRMCINPFYIKNKCGFCNKPVFGGPKCAVCLTEYHLDCGNLQQKCCELNLVSSESLTESPCPKCKNLVLFGPQCSICRSTFHNHCLSPHEMCCQLNLYENKKPPNQCGNCSSPVNMGPKCPLCFTIYHINCLGSVFNCCGVKFTDDEDTSYKCKRCKKKLSLTSPMCLYCGRKMHRYCLSKLKTCCGKRLSLEVYFIPSFKFMASYYKQFDRKRAMFKKKENMMHRESNKASSPPKMKNVSAQTITSHVEINNLEDITIVDVKSELEEELDIDEPMAPVLQREDNYSPQPSSSLQMPDITSGEDTLKNLFDFLYTMIKNFPPHVQSQVKVDLFKVVTEAEMRCCAPSTDH